MNARPPQPAITVACIAVATLGFSLNGPFGRILEFPSGVIAFGRGIFAAVSLLLVLLIRREKIFVFQSKKDVGQMVLLGILMSGNWFLFYESIKAASVAIAVVALYTHPFITSVLEPLLGTKRWSFIDCLGAIMVTIGVILVVPEFDLDNATTQGVLWGILSGACFSVRSILSRNLLERYTSTEMTLYQFFVLSILFVPFLFFNPVAYTVTNVSILVCFGSIVTTLTFVLFTYSLKRITVSLASILLSTQPICTVALNYMLVGDVPAPRTFLGGTIICCTILVVSIVDHVRSAETET